MRKFLLISPIDLFTMHPRERNTPETLMDSHKQHPESEDAQKRRLARKKGKSRYGLTSVEIVLPQIMGQMGLEKRLKEHGFMQLWFNVCGEELKNCSRPLFMDHQHNLVVGAKDASTAQEISLMRTGLLSKLGHMARALGVELRGIRVDLKNFHEPQIFEIPTDSANSLPLPGPEELNHWTLEEDDLALLKKVSEEVGSAVTDSGTTPLKDMIGNKVLQLLEQQLKLRSWRRKHGYPICQSCNTPAPRLHALNGSNICFNCSLDRD